MGSKCAASYIGGIVELQDVRLATSSPAIASRLPQNVTIDIRNHDSDYLQMERLTAANAPEAVPLFFESLSNNLNSSSNLVTNLNALLEPTVISKSHSTDEFNEEPRSTDFLLRRNGKNSIQNTYWDIANVSISILDGADVSSSAKSHRRGRRQAPEERDLSALPRWPGMPQGVLRQSDDLQIPAVKRKALSMMLQSMYSAQERLWPMEPVVKRYEHLTPYRMAFIFLKLDQLVYESHSILTYLERQTVQLSMTQRLQMYSHLMRRNIDITYLVDYISERVPRDEEVRVRQYVIYKEQKNLMTRWNKQASKKPSGRPQRGCDVFGKCA